MARTPRHPLGAALLPMPRLFDLTALRQAATAGAASDAEAWRRFREARRAAPNPLVRFAARLDDAYRTDEPEYLDRPDFPAHRRQALLTALDRFHRRLGTYERLCALLAPLVAAHPRRRALELAAGHGQLSIALDAALQAKGIDATIEGSDLAPELVELAQANARASNSSATFRVVDATRIDAPEGSYDVAINMFMMHHLPFELVVQVLRELRRVSTSAVIIDLVRSPLLYLPGGLLVAALSHSMGCVHDGLISLRKAWGAEEWQLAIDRSGWERSRIGVALPYVVVHLER